MVIVSKEVIKEFLIKDNKYWIVFTGDSLTSCEWVHPNWREIVIYVLQNEITNFLNGDWKLTEWGIKGFNFAYDGATTTDILKKVDDIICVNPQLIISLMGGNDPSLGIGVEESIDNIKEISKKVNSKGIKLVWCSSTPAMFDSFKNSQYKPYSNAFLKTQIDGVNKIDMFNKYQKFPLDKIFTFTSEENPVENIKEGEPDLIHPNQLGNAYIAKVILKDLFKIEFDPEKYIRETLEGKKYPGY